MQEIINRGDRGQGPNRAACRYQGFYVGKALRRGLGDFGRETKPNLWWIIPAVIMAIAAFIAVEILTAGAITGALPVILEIVAGVFLAQALAKGGGGSHLSYLEKSWAGDVAGAARRGLPAGLPPGQSNLFSLLLAEVGGAWR